MIDSTLWAVPVAVLLAGLWRPRWALLLFFASLPLFGAPPGGPYLAQLDTAAVAALAGSWRGGRTRPSRLDAGVAAFALASLLSLWPLAYLPPSAAPRHWLDVAAALPHVQAWGVLFTWRSAIDLLLGWALFLAVRRQFSDRPLRPLGLAVGAGLCATLVLGFADSLGWIDLWPYRPIGRPLYDDRLHSLFFHSGWFAEYLVLAAPFAVAALSVVQRWGRAAAAALAAACAVAVLLTQQRGGWITAVVQLLLLALLALPAWLRADRATLWRAARRAAAGVALGVLLLAAVLAARGDMRKGLESRLREAVSDLSARTWVWRASTDLALRRPLAGWGLGVFSPLLDAHYPSKVHPSGHQEGWLTAHSLYFHLLVERGVLGLLAAVWVGWLALGALLRQRRGPPDAERSLAAGLLASGVGFAVYGLVQYMFFLRAVDWLAWGLLGAVAALPGAAEEDSLPAAWRRRTALAAVLLALAAVLARPYLWAPESPKRGTRSYGLYAPEATADGRAFRWSDGRSAERIPRAGRVMLLPLANGHPAAASHPIEVTVRLDDRVAARRRLAGGWETLRLPVAEGREWVLVEIAVEPTFRPYRLPASAAPLRSRDIRRLGVAVGEIGWEAGPFEDGASGAAASAEIRTAPEATGAPASASNQATPSTTRSTVSVQVASTSGH